MGVGVMETIDLRKGYRIEVEPMVMPAGEYGARLYRPKGSRWKQVGRIVVASTPEQAARDLMTTINEGMMPGVEISAR